MKKQILSAVLALVMLLSVCAVGAFAEEEETYGILLCNARAFSDPERTEPIGVAKAGQTIYLIVAVGEGEYIENVICADDVQYNLAGEVIMPAHDLEMEFVVKPQEYYTVDLDFEPVKVGGLIINAVNSALTGNNFIEMKDEFVFDLNKDGKDDVKATVIPGGEGIPDFNVEYLANDGFADMITIEVGPTCPYNPIYFFIPPMPGDVTGDGKLNAKDVVQLMKCIIKGVAEHVIGSDFNRDGAVNAKDVVAIMKAIVAAK